MTKLRGNCSVEVLDVKLYKPSIKQPKSLEGQNACIRKANILCIGISLCGILMLKGLKEKIGFWQLLDSTQCFELLTQDT